MASMVRVSVLIWANLLAWFAMWIMITYLTNVWKISFTHAAGIVNILEGTAAILSVVFAFLVDAFTGNYAMLLLSSIGYTIGLGLLSISTPSILASDIGETQKVLFYIALPLIAVGIAGHMVSLVPFLDEQDTEKGSKFLLQIPGMLVVVIVGVIGAIALPCIKRWSIRFGVPAICTLLATLLFLSGSFSYEFVRPKGSSLTILVRVFVASASNMFRALPNDTNQLYEDYGQDLSSLPHTNGFRCLDKAAIRPTTTTDEEQKQNKWRLCRKTEVEETKIVIRMIPVWITFIIFGIVLSVGNTYFLEQANHMNRKVGQVKMPLTFFLLMSKLAKSIFPHIYTKIASPLRRYAPPTGIAVAMVISLLNCIIAAKVEAQRLQVIHKNGLLEKPKDEIPMTMMWLLPQFLLLGAHEGIYEHSIASFFASQAPQWVADKYQRFFSNGMLGLGIMSSVLSVYIAGRVSEMGGKTSWFQHTLNKSRLDNYYWTLAGLSAVNLAYYMVLSFLYTYKDSKLEDEEATQSSREASLIVNNNAHDLTMVMVKTSNSKLHAREWSGLSTFRIEHSGLVNSERTR